MKKVLVIFLLMGGVHSNAQINWTRDMKFAQSLAMSQNKFIVMDFWAIWCGPCKVMDRELWNTEEMNGLSKNFIALKIDVDENQTLAMKYGAKSIPKVIILDPAGNIIWQQVGFASASPFLKIFRELPSSQLKKADLLKSIDKEGDQFSWNSIAQAYQEMGRKTKSVALKKGFLNTSDTYFRKIEKKGSDETLLASSELNQILNNAYRGNIKKALKQTEKIGNSDSELQNFILAFCYKCDGQDDQMKKYSDLITNPDFLAQLE